MLANVANFTIYHMFNIMMLKTSLVLGFWSMCLLYLSPKKLIFCFSGTGAFVFFTSASKNLLKESCQYFRQTKICCKNLTQKSSPPRIRFSKKWLRNRRSIFVSVKKMYTYMRLSIPRHDCDSGCLNWIKS